MAAQMAPTAGPAVPSGLKAPTKAVVFRCP